MTLEDIIEASKTLKASSAEREVLQASLAGIETALSDIAEIMEREKSKDDMKTVVAAIVRAINNLKMPAPQVTVSPTIEVQPAQVTVQAATPNNVVNVEPTPIQNSITVPPAEVHVHERPVPKITKVEFEYVGDRIYGATITRE